MKRAYSVKHESVLQILGIPTKTVLENDKQTYLLQSGFLNEFLHLTIK